MKPGAITTTCCPPETADGAMEVETICGNEVEIVTCKSFTGVAEFQDELLRVLLLRKRAQHWEPVVVRLIYGDFEHQKVEIA